MLKELDDQCHCQIPSNAINDESFACFDDSANYVTYRARLRGTSAVNSASLFSLIENWATSGPAIRVRGILMRADTQCPVAISSFSDEGCSNPTDETNKSSNTVVIVGGVVAAITVTVGLIAVVALIVLVRKYCCIKLSLKRTEE